MKDKTRTFSRDEIFRANKHVIQKHFTDNSNLPINIAKRISSTYYTREQLNEAFSQAMVTASIARA